MKVCPVSDGYGCGFYFLKVKSGMASHNHEVCAEGIFSVKLNQSGFPYFVFQVVASRYEDGFPFFRGSLSFIRETVAMGEVINSLLCDSIPSSSEFFGIVRG